MTEAPGSQYTVEVPPALHRQRADKVLAELIPGLSRSQIQKLLERGLAWREDTSLSQDQKLREGDVVQLTVPPARPMELRPVPMALDIVFEDADLLVLNKPPGLVVHPGAGTGEDTLVHGLLHHCGHQLPQASGVERPGIVHRLDKETSGLLAVAKSDAAWTALAEAFAERRVVKEYLAFVLGQLPKPQGTTEAPIGRHPTQRTRMAVVKGGRPSRTDWELVERVGDFSLLRLRLHTGRTHQIRVHLADLGHPLAGDETYGYRPGRTGVPFPRVMLHAARLAFAHPRTGEPLDFSVPAPADFAQAVEALRS